MESKSIIKDILMFLLKFLLVILLVVVAAIIGVMIGYSVIGNGGSPLDVFNLELWNHILNFFT